ncbi:angiopoietin-1-like [Saccostrea cucullata]|uniref:angiopoietin-1-like n=1 Tax=Saccostrea cuccullata TaxID=36930 RepID=UPI002ED53142
MDILQSLVCLIIYLNVGQVSADSNILEKSILDGSTTSEGKVSSILRDILNQESLVRFSMVQRMQNLVMDVIESKNNSQVVKHKMKILTKELKDLETRDNGMETEVTKLKQMFNALNETVRSNQDRTIDTIQELKDGELVSITNKASVLQKESQELLVENRKIKQQLEMQNKTISLLNVSYNVLQEEIKQIKNRELDVGNKSKIFSTDNELFREQLNDVRNTLRELKGSLYKGRFQKMENSFRDYSISINETLDGLLEDHRVLNQQVLNVSSSLSNVELILQPKSCYNVLEQNKSLKGKDGVYKISINSDITSVFCDMTTDGGGWTVIQKRIDGSTDFYRTWEEYKKGFGDPKNNYWIGNDAIHVLTKDQDQELRIDLQRFNGDTAYAEYSTFYIGNEADKYRLTVSGYTGTAGKSIHLHNNGMAFSTKDRDNHRYSGNCAVSYHGAWWYNNCHHSNLNGLYGQSGDSGGQYPVWWHWKRKEEALKQTLMMIRHKN